MKSKNIEDVNHALVVLKHFIDLSSKLLPFLDEINRKNNPSLLEISDRQKIIEVYKNYDFDITTSKILMDSNILGLIHQSYEKLMRIEPANDDLQAFTSEYVRLRKNWKLIDAN